jgi:hypothetical protein
MKILQLIEEYNFVRSYEVVSFKKWDTGFYHNIRIDIRDGTCLYAREYVDEQQRNYSYHWQDPGQSLLARWDNSPHHKNIVTFPHHRHTRDDKIIESREITLKEILEYIKESLE